MKRKKHFRAGVEEREFKLFKVLLKEMFANGSNKEIDNADELHIKIDMFTDFR